MKYLVKLTGRSLRDMEVIYNYVGGDASQHAFAWFNRLAKALYTLERFPGRGPAISENKKLRHLLFGKKPHVYRIIYAVDKRNHVVNVLHIRHGLRAALSAK
jgi:plasmid stabilization system protein ParE